MTCTRPAEHFTENHQALKRRKFFYSNEIINFPVSLRVIFFFFRKFFFFKHCSTRAAFALTNTNINGKHSKRCKNIWTEWRAKEPFRTLHYISKLWCSTQSEQSYARYSRRMCKISSNHIVCCVCSNSPSHIVINILRLFIFLFASPSGHPIPYAPASRYPSSPTASTKPTEIMCITFFSSGLAQWRMWWNMLHLPRVNLFTNWTASFCQDFSKDKYQHQDSLTLIYVWYAQNKIKINVKTILESLRGMGQWRRSKSRREYFDCRLYRFSSVAPKISDSLRWPLSAIIPVVFWA